MLRSLIKENRFDSHQKSSDGALVWMKQVCGPHKLRVATPSNLDFRYQGIMFNELSTIIGRIKYGTDASIRIQNFDPLSCYSISLPITGEQELKAGKKSILSNPSTGIIANPRFNQEILISERCLKTQVAISTSSLNSVLMEMIEEELIDDVFFESTMDLNDERTASWWKTVEYILKEKESGFSVFENPHWSFIIEKNIIKDLLTTQPNNYSNKIELKSNSHIPPYISKLLLYIRDNAKNDLNLSDIVATAGVAQSKLYTDLKKYVNKTPLELLKEARLKGIRNEILRSKGARPISSIALDWGLLHLGRFSIDYRMAFGELPSETAKKIFQSTQSRC